MRLRVGLVLCLFVAYIAAGCRTALAPNIDRNFAPETWITAAEVPPAAALNADVLVTTTGVAVPPPVVPF